MIVINVLEIIKLPKHTLIPDIVGSYQGCKGSVFLNILPVFLFISKYKTLLAYMIIFDQEQGPIYIKLSFMIKWWKMGSHKQQKRRITLSFAGLTKQNVLQQFY